MEKCLPKYSSVLGLSSFIYVNKAYFKNVKQHITEITNYLNKEDDKEKFRNTCRDLANYLIEKKKAPHYYNQRIWEGTLIYWLQVYYKNLNKYGGCPMILEKEHKDILELKYEEEDFCERRIKDLQAIKQLKSNHLRTCDGTYLRKCIEYKQWINEKKIYFEKMKNLFQRCYHKNKKKKPKSTCNILDEVTFNVPPECLSLHLEERCQNLSKTHGDLSQKKTEIAEQSPPFSYEQKEHLTQIPSQSQQQPPDEAKSNHEGQSQHEGNPPQEGVTGPGEQSQQQPIPNSDVTIEDVTRETPNGKPSPDIILSGSTDSEDQPLKSQETSTLTHTSQKNAQVHSDSKNTFLTISTPLPSLGFPPSESSKILGKYLTHDHTESSLYDEEQIIKKLKIHEHVMIKNINTLKQKKDRFKTIIEVHMEVLEELRNEEWEFKKKEFLVICQEMFETEKHKTYPNLINEDLIVENTKSNNDIEKKIILCNKWIREYSNISENLKKTDWFNYLKNEWKNEKASIKNSVELKMNFSNENQKFSFLEKEKDLWKKWISNKRIIVEQYLKQECFVGLTQEFLNVSDEHVNEEIKNNTLLLNTEELQKESYEELYNHLKKKLIAKMCILVFMMVLEDCQKENLIENEELHLDRSINDWKTGANLERKTDVTREINDVNDITLENRENRKTPAHIGEKTFRQEIENWVREDDTLENSIYNENSVE
ncbi:STP1 protein [Plasmodium malariae]|uniref:STP1 protein n=1 Tax=Plasmodium malariae TaxID=5858 RepID=A0A1A8X7F5_PLAMA|nr:STP1 protein [Plasmodium malariae]